MEDDIELARDAARAIDVIERVLPSVGLVRLGGRNLRGRVIRRLTEGSWSLVRYPRRLVGAYCYAISPAAAKQLIAHANTWREPVDEYIDRFWVHGVEIVGLCPFVAMHPVESELGTEIGAVRGPKRLRGFAKLRREFVRLVDVAQRGQRNLAAWLSS